jgi:hypothetical protein
LFSLPQLSGHEVVNGLPFVPVPKDAEVLDSLMTFLYPVPSQLPSSKDKILTLLAACQKYDMMTIQSSIRAEISCRGLLLPMDTNTFHLFAVVYRKSLVLEMRAAAHLMLGYPMTFKSLGEALRSFEGLALFDLYCFHQQCRDEIESCSKVFLDACTGPSKVWVGCPTSPSPNQTPGEDGGKIPFWFHDISIEIFQPNRFMYWLVKPFSFHEEYLEALRDHINKKDCSFCMKTHALKGEEFCIEIENQITQAWDMEYSFSIELPGSKLASPPSVSSR